MTSKIKPRETLNYNISEASEEELHRFTCELRKDGMNFASEKIIELRLEFSRAQKQIEQDTKLISEKTKQVDEFFGKLDETTSSIIHDAASQLLRNDEYYHQAISNFDTKSVKFIEEIYTPYLQRKCALKDKEYLNEITARKISDFRRIHDLWSIEKTVIDNYLAELELKKENKFLFNLSENVHGDLNKIDDVRRSRLKRRQMKDYSQLLASIKFEDSVENDKSCIQSKILSKEEDFESMKSEHLSYPLDKNMAAEFINADLDENYVPLISKNSNNTNEKNSFTLVDAKEWL